MLRALCRSIRHTLKARVVKQPCRLIRAQLASDAGLSGRQGKTALPTTAVPAGELGRRIESDHPLTVMARAER